MTRIDQLPSTSAPTTSRVPILLRAKALGAVAGQLSQALASFVLQLLAARELGASGLGLFALVLSVLIMMTAVSSGLLGDSFTILDRGDPAIRAGIQRWGVVVVVVGGLTATLAARLSGTLDGTSSVLFGLALVAYLVEDLARRLLMASMRFWSLIAVDLTSLVVYLATIAGWAVLGHLDIATFLVALILGQGAATVVGVLLLPRHERHWAAWAPAAVGPVFRFGFWRAAQQSIRPTMLTVTRLLITMAVGRELFGQLEAGRVYMAPAMLVVQGAGSYLISSYARLKTSSTSSMIRRADRAALIMLVGALVVGVAATLVVPVLGPLLTGGGYELSRLNVFGWAVYAASAAALMPFASLAAVRGRQSLVVGLRLTDSLISLGCVAVVVLVLKVDIAWSSYALAVGSFAGGLIIRWFVLKPLQTEETR